MWYEVIDGVKEEKIKKAKMWRKDKKDIVSHLFGFGAFEDEDEYSKEEWCYTHVFVCESISRVNWSKLRNDNIF